MKTRNTLPLFFAALLFTVIPVTVSAQAPSSLAGNTLDITITNSTGPYFGSGNVRFIFDSGNFVGVDLAAGTTRSGTYSYAYAGYWGQISMYYEAHSCATMTMTLYFNNASTGDYTTTVDCQPGEHGVGPFLLGKASDKPSVPNLINPETGYHIYDGAPNFSWSHTVPASTWYHIYLQRNGSKCLEQWTQSSAFTPSDRLPGGEYTWWVQGWNSAGVGPWSLGYTFSVPANIPGVLTPSYPAGGVEQGERVHYLWNMDPYATWYQVCITADGATFLNNWYSAESLHVNIESMDYCYLEPDGHRPGAYAWWVRGWSPDGMGPWSGMGSFTVTGNAPAVIQLNSPGGSFYNAGSVQFSWHPDTRATWYELCVTKNGQVVTDQWYPANGNSNKFFEVTQSGYSAGNYTWWVRGWGPDGMGPWSSSMSFELVPYPLSAPTLSSPNSTAYTPRPTFQWQTVYGATWYYIYVQKNGAKYCDGWASTSSWTPTVDLTPGAYTWWVRGWNPDGYGPLSSSLTFTQAGSK